jgi:hypothetical protein
MTMCKEPVRISWVGSLVAVKESGIAPKGNRAIIFRSKVRWGWGSPTDSGVF